MNSSSNVKKEYKFINKVDIKSANDLDKMRIAGQAVARVLQTISKKLCPGMTTKFIDELAFNEINSIGMKPAFLGYRGFPATTCISINQELVHGIPKKDKIINEGDIVSIDLGVIYEGFYGDTAGTYGVGKISDEAKNLLDVTKNSLKNAINFVSPKNRLGDISYAVQNYVEMKGYSVVKEYVGHGIGRQLHEEPAIPNFGKQNTGMRLMPGMVMAIEPMVNVGDWHVKTLDDGWTVETVDGKLCAHFEHMVAVTEDGYEILTEI